MSPPRARASGGAKSTGGIESWTPEQAAQMVRLPVATVHQWITLALVEPSVPLDAGGQERPRLGIGLTDLLCFRLAADLLALGVPRDVIRELAREVQGPRDRFLPWRELIREEWWYLLPTHEDFMEAARKDRERPEVLTVFTSAQVQAMLADGDDWTTQDRLPVMMVEESPEAPVAVLWPVSEVIAELVDAVDLWRIRQGIPIRAMPPWL